MMHPNAFNDDLQESGIPMFGRNGTALSHQERSAIAARRGLCLKCGVKTHTVQIMRKTAITSDSVYKGICIKCNPGNVPANVLQEWQSRNAQMAPVQPVNRFKASTHAVRATQGPRPHRPPGMVGRPHSRNLSNHGNHGPSGPIMGSEGPLVPGIQRKDSRPGDALMRSSSLHGDPNTMSVRVPMRGRAPPNRGMSASMAASQQQHGMSTSHLGTSGHIPQHGLDSEEYKSVSDQDSWTLLKELEDNKDKPDVLRSKLHGFRNLADDQAGAPYVFKDIMDKYRNDSRLMMVAVGSIWGISSKDDDKKQEALDTGCLDLVVDMIRNGKTKDDPEFVHWALGTISCLARLNDNKNEIANKGGLETIVEALKRYENHPTVFEWACRALYTLVSDYENEDNEISFSRDMTTIEDASGIRVIISAMNQHIPESIAQYWALQFLFRLHDRSDPGAVDRAMQMMMDADLASTCIKIIKSRSVTTDVLIQCQHMLVVLMSFATNGLLHQHASECIPTVTRVMSEQIMNKSLMESCATFLAAVAQGNDPAKKEVIEGNALHSLLPSMAESPENLELQRAGSRLLWVLSAYQHSFDYSVAGKVKQIVEAACSAHPNDEELNESILGYIGNTAGFLQGRADSIPSDLVVRFTGTPGAVGKQASRALAGVCIALPDVADKAVRDGLIDRLLEGLMEADVDIQCSSSAALAAMAGNSEKASKKITSAGGVGSASAGLLTTSSEGLAMELLTLVNTIVGSRKAVQLPNEIALAIMQAASMFPSQTRLACSTIRNAMLVTIPGFTSIAADGLVDWLCGIIDSHSSPQELVMEASGALWAYLAKQAPSDPDDLLKVVHSVVGLCARHKGEGPTPYNGPVLTEAAGAVASVLHCIRDNPIQIPETDVDMIIAVLDIVIECDIENILLMDLLMESVLTLCFLCKDLLIQFGVIVVIIDCMVEHEGNEIIQQKGCAILALLASTENLQVNLSIAETDGIDMIVSALAGFTENAQIQTDACRALSHLSIDHESRMLISSQGGLILLVNAMNRFRDDVDLHEAACSALLNLSSDAEEQVLAGSNVVETVIATMQYQLNSPRLQEKSLGVLQNVSMRSRDAKRAIAEAGGIGAVTFAIKEFMGSPSVLERAFTAMWSLAVLEDNQHHIANEGGINLVINGMMANITFEKVQKQACGCLCTLSSNSRNKTLIRDLGGVDAIVYAMWAHYNSDALLIEACRALSSLAVNVQTNEVMIASEGEISAIMSAMRRFPQSERLQEHACVALRNFLLSADNAAIVRPQAVELEELMNSASVRFPDRCGERARQVLASLR